MSTVPTPPVLGLPEGVQLLRIGAAEADDYELVSTGGVIQIFKGPRVGAASGVIVVPAEGYSFRFDIKTYSYYVVKNLPPTEIHVELVFNVTTDVDSKNIDLLIDRAKMLPGFQSMSKS
jgi:hypothetical protein